MPHCLCWWPCHTSSKKQLHAQAAHGQACRTAPTVSIFFPLAHLQDVFNIFLGALFGGTVLAELRTFLENPSHIWSALGSAIPAASNFFM